MVAEDGSFRDVYGSNVSYQLGCLVAKIACIAQLPVTESCPLDFRPVTILQQRSKAVHIMAAQEVGLRYCTYEDCSIRLQKLQGLCILNGVPQVMDVPDYC